MNTTTLETSKKLKEAGFPQESEHIYLEWKHKSGLRNQLLKRSTPTKIGVEYAAPIAEEILDRLPYRLFKDNTEYWLKFDKWNDLYLFYYEGNGIAPDLKNDDSNYVKSLAEASALMWLYLKENNLLEKERNK